MDAEARVREGFARQQFMHLIGATLASAVPGEVEIRVDCRPDLTQHTGVVHAGVVTAIVDSACGFAALTMMTADRGHDDGRCRLAGVAIVNGRWLSLTRHGATLPLAQKHQWRLV